MAASKPQLDADQIVMFDNNAYGDLVAGRDAIEVDQAVADLTTAERRNGVQALANPFVLLELTALLNDPGRPAFKSAEHGLIALAGHCRIETPAGPVIGSIHDTASLISKELYDRIPESHLETSRLLISLAAYIAQERPAQLPEEAKHLVTQASQHVELIEQQFEDEMYRYAVKGLDPNATDWAPLKDNPSLRAQALAFLDSPEATIRFGDMLLQQALEALGIEEPPHRQLELSGAVAGMFEAPRRLFNEILRRIFTTGCNLTKPNRRNWVWDVHIACSVGVDHAVDGKPLWLITSDKDILAAATKAGCGHLVHGYDEYRRGLESGLLASVGERKAE